MYQRHSFGAPPPIFTPPPAPYNPKHRAYARPTVPHQDVAPHQAVVPHQVAAPHQDGGFPYQLSLRPTQSRAPQPVPAIAFSENITQSVADIFNKQVNIYVTPTDYFTTKFRKIFAKTKIKFTTAKYARKWLAKPDMSFSPQQLNFALWCATTGCGVSREMLFSNSTFNSSLNLSEQIRTFYQFHVYYTTERSCMRWAAFRARTLCLTTRPSTSKITPTTLRPISGSARSLVLTRARTFASPMGKTTGWGT